MTALLEVRGLRVDYGDDAVLKGIDLDIPHGEFAALIGPNGAGKTTFLRSIVDMAPVTGGSIRTDGHDLATASRAAKSAVGFMVDPERLPKLLTGRECLALFAGARGLPGIPQTTYELGETLALTPVLDRRVDNYSLGMRQKLGILLGLTGGPPLLLLDEPFNGLDPRSALLFKQYLADLVARRQTAILLATHALDVAERYATRALLLIDGRIRHAWNADELADLRDDPRRSLEQAMAEACEGK